MVTWPTGTRVRRTTPVALFDALEPGYDEAPPDDEPEAPYEQPASAVAEAGRRKGRSSMPSWDEIVFGARGDE